MPAWLEKRIFLIERQNEMTNEERIIRLENSFVILTELARSTYERMDAL